MSDNPWASPSPWAEPDPAPAPAAPAAPSPPLPPSALPPPPAPADEPSPFASTSAPASPPPSTGPDTSLPADQAGPSLSPPPPTPPAESQLEDSGGGLDDDNDNDDDDFDFQDPTSASNTHDADFDDFGDFDDAAPIEAAAAEPALPPPSLDADQSAPAGAPAAAVPAQQPDPPPAPVGPSWTALPDPRTLSHDELLAAIRQLLPSLASAAASADSIVPASQLPIRPKSSPHARTGLLALAPGAQAAWDDLVSRPPKGYKPVSWARSGARRRLYTALGVPINLDEELPPSVSGSLPPLKISLLTSENGGGEKGSARGGSANNSGRNTPQPGKRSASTPNPGPPAAPKPPPLDRARIEALLQLTPDKLTLLPLSALRTLATELRTHTAATSSTLAHYLQRRDTLANDAETYNTMIRDLVAGAASRIASGGGGTGAGGTPRNSTGPGARGSGTLESPTTAGGGVGWGARTPRSSTPLGR